jgi:cell wall-associated NlpC family hydrolase
VPDEKSNNVVGAGKEIAQAAALGAARGGTAGAVVGAGKALIKKRNRKWLYILLAVGLLPDLLTLLVLSGVFAAVTGVAGIEGTQESAAIAASGVPSAQYSNYEGVASHFGIPWEILAAIAYYESGPGYGAGNTTGTCPPNRTVWTEAYCPSTSPGSAGSGVLGAGPACMPGAASPVIWAKPGKYSWTVPAGVGMVAVSLSGGAGGGRGASLGAGGGTVKGCAHVSAGQKLSVYVGSMGASNSPGGGRPAPGGTGYGTGGAGASGGGGSSAVVDEVSLVAVAGGGGGAGAGSSAGGDGEGGSGQPGRPVIGRSGASTRAGGGSGGTKSGAGCGTGPVGGAAGRYATGQYAAGRCGTGHGAGDGGAGGVLGAVYGGGGGAGYFGGGGGGAFALTRPAPGSPATSSGGGGGGASWAAPSVNGASFGTQQVPGPGEVQISYSAGTGPFGLTKASGLPQSQALSRVGAGMYLAQQLSVSLAREPYWASDNSVGFLADEVIGANGPSLVASRWGARTTMSDFVAALSKLPIEANSKVLDDNIYELASDWGLGQSLGGAGVPATDMVCGAWNGSSMLVSGPLGVGVELSQAQMTNAVIITHVGQQMGLPDNALQIALGTALEESTLWDYPNPSVPGSETDPNVQWGAYSPSNPPSTGSSVGLFQQQVGIWDHNTATVAEAMDPQWAAQTFYAALEGVPGWQSASTPAQMGVVAQTVQASAHPRRYQWWMPGAATLLGAVLQVSCQGTVSATGRAAVVVAAAEKWVGNTPYVWGGGGPSGPSGSAVGPAGYAGKPGFDCSGLVEYALAQVGIMVPHYSVNQFDIVQAAGGFTTNIAQLQPGDLVFFIGAPSENGTPTRPGHVGIYIGNGEMVNAPYTGTLVSISPVTQSTAGGFVGGGPAW